MEILSILKKIIYKINWKDAIYDDVKYEQNMNSFCGNSLRASNVAVIYTNKNFKEKNEAIFFEVAKCEGFDLVCCALEEFNGFSELEEKLIGKFEHIINVVELNDLFDIYSLYKLLQIESDYLVNQESIGSICNVMLTNSKCVNKEPIVRCLTEGLGYVMPNHEILINGIVADSNIGFNRIVESAVFMSSKYGFLLTGTTLKLAMDER